MAKIWLSKKVRNLNLQLLLLQALGIPLMVKKMLAFEAKGWELKLQYST